MKRFEIGGQCVEPGSHQHITLPALRLYNDAPLDLRIDVFHGTKPGPVLLVSAAIHGDELNGIEVCRRLINTVDARELAGTLVVVPIVNLFGFIQQSRYLPDRRDLNRCFPGSERGAMGSRMAYLFSEELVKKSTHIVDLHTGAINRSNLPQIRVDVENEKALAMAKAFSTPVILHSKERDGSLRALANELNIPLILYEAGEALRFDEASISAGVIGVQNVMKHLKIMKGRRRGRRVTPVIARRSTWVRAERDGLIIPKVELGQTIQKQQVLALSVSPHGGDGDEVESPVRGIIIGCSNIPVANEGEALFNVAQFDKDTMSDATESVGSFTEVYENKPYEQ
ncbi:MULTISPECIES: succinylglutamate desuccinylase/aspartoacylase family protein [Idiomarina]|uniref:succinylglutamate desuccinylase/aspartoacylase family protein n=1 Tax=Idiomarina TaxID=135575 RepID=UPI000C447CDD|nr:MULTISPECIES: succinylglutamate desuccinylase/aspartoacylase family protein [Idiomarina]MBP59094.1 succinylglutamate desuccinylase [Idiomarina sp.]|tara:strand:- start:4246 stop:5268 length:1023 start_codon:yes stop_codon:yes gene_type:complete